MRRRFAVPASLLGLFLFGATGVGTTSVIRPTGLPQAWQAEPLGWVRVTQYTHVETRSRVTSSGYVLKDADEGLACAISRDWWRKRVKPGDLVWIEGFARPCAALDTMALRNPRGLKQTRWIDIYVTDPARGLEFGIRKSSAYIVTPADGDWKPRRDTRAARDLRRSL